MNHAMATGGVKSTFAARARSWIILRRRIWSRFNRIVDFRPIKVRFDQVLLVGRVGGWSTAVIDTVKARNRIQRTHHRRIGRIGGAIAGNGHRRIETRASNDTSTGVGNQFAGSFP